MARLASWLLVLFSLGVLLAVTVHVLRERILVGKDMPSYSMYSAETDTGLSETAWLLQQLGWDPEAVAQPIHHTRHRGLLLVVEPSEPISEADVDGMIRWVEEGNTLALISRNAIPLHGRLGIAIHGDEQARPSEVLLEVIPDEAGAYTDGIDRLVVESPGILAGGEGLPLWSIDGQPAAVLQQRGAGRIVVIGDPSLLTRRGLRRQDNVMVLYNLVRLHAVDGRVYFDEYHHGLRAGGGFWGYLRYHDQQWTVLAVLLAAVAAWSVAVRLGPAVPLPRPSQADAVDYASAVARIYQHAGVRHLLAAVLARDFLTRLCRHLRLRKGALPVEILAAWQRHHPDQPARPLQDLLRGVAELRGGDVSDRRLLMWARAFDRFQNEVLSASRR